MVGWLLTTHAQQSWYLLQRQKEINTQKSRGFILGYTVNQPKIAKTLRHLSFNTKKHITRSFFATMMKKSCRSNHSLHSNVCYYINICVTLSLFRK